MGQILVERYGHLTWPREKGPITQRTVSTLKRDSRPELRTFPKIKDLVIDPF